MAGLIPQTFINDLIDRVDIVDVIDSRVTLKKTGKNYSGLCPFHDEKSPSFSVSPEKQFFHCFGCQESGTALTFLMKFERMEFVEAVEYLARELGLEVPREQGSKPRVQIDHGLYHALEAAQSFYKRELRGSAFAIDYFKSRGLTGTIARDFALGYAPEGWHNLSEEVAATTTLTAKVMLEAGLTIKNDKGRVYDRFRHRAMFPIRDTRGRVIGFGGRKFGDEEGPKYLNSPETPVFQKSQELYGLYEARRALRHIDRLVVVEGYMDVIALAQHEIPYAVATLGTATGEAHYHKLYKYADEVICCFDGDKAGRSAAWRALESALPVLNEQRQLKFVFLPNGEDPDSMVRKHGREEVERIFANASPGLEFLLKRLSEGLDLDTLDGRAKFMGLATPYVDKIKPGILQDMLRSRVREISGMAAPIGGISQRITTAPRSAPNASKARRGSEALCEKMGAILLKDLALWWALDNTLREGLVPYREDMGLFGELIDFINRNAELTIDELLIAWPNDDTQEALIAWAKKPVALATGLADKDGVKREFCDEGMPHLLSIHEKAHKQQLRQRYLREGEDQALLNELSKRRPSEQNPDG